MVPCSPASVRGRTTFHCALSLGGSNVVGLLVLGDAGLLPRLCRRMTAWAVAHTVRGGGRCVVVGVSAAGLSIVLALREGGCGCE